MLTFFFKSGLNILCKFYSTDKKNETKKDGIVKNNWKQLRLARPPTSKHDANDGGRKSTQLAAYNPVQRSVKKHKQMLV